MSIDINNYEAYWLDYLEGNLSAEDKVEFVAFALVHPELEIELEEDSELIYLDNTSTASIDKTSLKSIASPTDDEFIHYIEGQLSLEEEAIFLETIHSNPDYQQQLNVWRKTILEKPEIHFPKKSQLKQYSISPVIYSTAAAAAIIVFFFVVGKENQNRTYFNDSSVVATIQPINLDSNEEFEFTINSQKNFVNSSNNTSGLAEEKQIQDSLKEKLFNTDFEIKEDFNNQIANTDVNEKEDSTEISPISITPNFEDDLATSNPNQNSLTVKEWVITKLQEKEVLDSTENNPTILEIAANTVGDYSSKETDDEKVTSFKIGKFEYYRKKSKHL